MEKNRYLTQYILEDLSKKMVFIGGARQVGKTTLARKIISKNFAASNYYNWDFPPDRKKITKFEFPGESGLLIFDEIHKYKKWKTTIKGLYDTYKDKYKILVTGSARMNIFRKGGDSLQGRYHYYNLHPFSLAELLNIRNNVVPFGELSFQSKHYRDELDMLLKFGGFPEVLIKQNSRELRRWHNEKLDRLFREDIRDVENIRDLDKLKLLGDLLPSRAANPLSINAIREDLEVSHRAVTSWLSILEHFYYHYRIYPFHSIKIRSIKKEPKFYLTDWSEVENESARLENLVASHLLKFIEFLRQSEGYNTDLYYLRNVDRKEVDFFISIDSRPWFAVEVKLNETKPSNNLLYYRERLDIPFTFQVIGKTETDILKNEIRIISADKFLTGLI